MSMPSFSPKDPDEMITLTWDFSAGLATGETLTAVTAMDLWVQSGSEDPPALVLNGEAQIDESGTMVLQVVSAGTDGIGYGMKPVVTTSNVNKILALSALLPVAC